MGMTGAGRLGALAMVLTVATACSSVSEAGEDAAMDAYRTAHPTADRLEVQRTMSLADCDYVEVLGSAGLEKMTVTRDSTPRVLQIAKDGPEYFDSDYDKDALNTHCTAN